MKRELEAQIRFYKCTQCYTDQNKTAENLAYAEAVFNDRKSAPAKPSALINALKCKKVTWLNHVGQE